MKVALALLLLAEEVTAAQRSPEAVDTATTEGDDEETEGEEEEEEVECGGGGGGWLGCRGGGRLLTAHTAAAADAAMAATDADDGGDCLLLLFIRDRFVGEMGPEMLMPCAEPPEYVKSCNKKTINIVQTYIICIDGTYYCLRRWLELSLVSLVMRLRRHAQVRGDDVARGAPSVCAAGVDDH